MYVDDTTIYCIADNTADMAVAQLNKVLDEVYRWCLKNRLTPHPGKSEVMLIRKGTTWGPWPQCALATQFSSCLQLHDCLA